MEARQCEQGPARRDALFRQMLLVRFVPALIAVVWVGAYGWQLRATHVLFPWLTMVGGLASAGYTAVKRHRASQPPIPLDVSDQVPWIMLLTAGGAYLVSVLFDARSPWLPIVTLAMHIRRVLFGD